MKLHALNCHNCGGLLKVPDHARYVTCSYCGSQLAVKKSEGVRFTEAIEEIHDRLDELTDKKDLQLLNMEWAAERESFMVSCGQNGQRQIPTRAGAWGGGIIIAAFGTVWTCAAGSFAMMGPFNGFALFFPLFGVVFIVTGIVMAIDAYRKAIEYEKANTRYQQRKDVILRKLRAAGQRGHHENDTEPESTSDVHPRWKKCDYFGLVPNDSDDPWKR
jgi:uncharacterized membrane protein/DNA-directed RNA polymerase subunit RPC12/RpoP